MWTNYFFFFKQEKRRLEKATLSDVTNEKREPQRCYGGHMGGCRKGKRVFNNEMVSFINHFIAKRVSMGLIVSRKTSQNLRH